MFNKDFVVAIKVNGKILREVQDVVYLPFGSEYSILLKNVSTRKAQVNVSIDGQDVTEDCHLIIKANESTELKRFIRNRNLDTGNAFKFIEKTAQIEQFRGNKIDDGLITVSYEFEKEKPQFYGYPLQNNTYAKTQEISDPNWQDILRRSTLKGGNLTSNASSSVNYSQVVPDSFTPHGSTIIASQSYLDNNYNDSGVTAPGSIVNQQFTPTSSLVTDGIKHSITLQLKGGDGTRKVQNALTVKKVQRCIMCGTNTKQTAKFCHNCGASVELI